MANATQFSYKVVTSPTNVKFNQDDAIKRIELYCNQLPSQRNADKQASFIVKPIENVSLGPNGANGPFICEIRLPEASPLHEVSIQGSKGLNKGIAKSSACLEAVKLLWAYQELDDSFMPSKREKATNIMAKNRLDRDASETRAKKILTEHIHPPNKTNVLSGKRQCAKIYSEAFLGSLGSFWSSCCLYRVDLGVKTMKSIAAYGLLTPKPLPLIEINGNLQIYLRNTAITVTIEKLKEGFRLGEQNGLRVIVFHKVTMEKAADRLSADLTFDLDECSYKLAFTFLTASGEIDFTKMQNVEEKRKIEPCDYGSLKGCIVSRRYGNEQDNLLVVEEVDRSKSPRSSFNCKGFSTYEQYYEKKYDQKIDPYQPLLKFSHVPKYHFTPMPIENKAKMEPLPDKANYLIPELCDVHPYAQEHIPLAQVIPALVWKLNRLLIASEFRKQLCQTIGYGFQEIPQTVQSSTATPRFTRFVPIKMEPSRPKTTIQTMQELLSGSVLPGKVSIGYSIYNDACRFSKHGVYTHLMMDALTTRQSNFQCNLERMEVLGDSFLKFVTSIYFFIKYPMLNESSMSSFRQNMVNNVRLAEFGFKKHLDLQIADEHFNPKVNWLPPFYSSKNSSFNQQSVSEKSIADMVEALVGAHLISLGESATVKFLTWIGFPFQFKEVSRGSWLPPPAKVIQLSSRPLGSISQAKLHQFQLNTLEYKFKHESLLIEALSHPSSTTSGYESYQRLEFIGDAILDYLITCYIYDHPDLSDFGPGQITILRQKLVNNDYFATLAMVNGFDQYLAPPSQQVLKNIEDYRKRLTRFRSFGNDSKMLGPAARLQLNNDSNCSPIKIETLTDAPKVLADIFESIAGAIWLDSGYSLGSVWDVYSPMMRNELAQITKNCRF